MASGVLAGGVLLFAIGKYFANPYGLQTWDWRSRVLGGTIYRLPSGSMEPTLHEGRLFWVDVAVLGTRDPRPQEIVVMRMPPVPDALVVKRIVARGGQTIEMRDGAVFIDGKQLDEPYLANPPLVADEHGSFAPMRVPEGSFFVLGDNRANSVDSRIWGFIRRQDIVGIHFPPEKR